MDSSLHTTADITGDGVPEKIEANTFRSGDSFYTRHLIYMDDKLIYSDKLKAFVDISAPKGSDEKEYKRLHEMADFTEAVDLLPILADQKSRNFVEEPVTLGMYRGTLETKGLTASEIDNAMVDYKKYLRNFKGKLIATNTEDADLYMWYEPWHKMIVIYSP